MLGGVPGSPGQRTRNLPKHYLSTFRVSSLGAEPLTSGPFPHHRVLGGSSPVDAAPRPPRSRVPSPGPVSPPNSVSPPGSGMRRDPRRAPRSGRVKSAPPAGACARPGPHLPGSGGRRRHPGGTGEGGGQALPPPGLPVPFRRRKKRGQGPCAGPRREVAFGRRELRNSQNIYQKEGGREKKCKKKRKQKKKPKN